MRAIDPASALNYRACEHARPAHFFQTNARANDVHDRIHRAHFVEMDFFRRQAMDFTFRDGDALENGN